MTTLTDEQVAVIHGVLGAIRSGQRLVTVGGYAGTGKTTIIQELVARFGSAAVVIAPTGKAADVLRDKGNAEARTLHSLVYRPPAVVERKVTDSNGCVSIKRELEFNDLRSRVDAAVVIVDEASMVGRKQLADLMSFDIPVVLVGDHGQLEPVEQSDGWRHPVFTPQFRLETIHRNAGPIARFAHHLRNALAPHDFAEDAAEVCLSPYAYDDVVRAADQVIVAWNWQRAALNARIRRLLGFAGPPKLGERIISLDSKNGLRNGQQGIIAAIDAERITFAGARGVRVEDIKYEPRSFGVTKHESVARDMGTPHRFDFGYAITGHKAQGSEWGHVVVVEPKYGARLPAWTPARWAYTAATRARKQLTWVLA